MATTSDTSGFTEEEKAAMRDRAREQKKTAGKKGKATGEADVLEKIAEMKGADRTLAERLHALIQASAPDLAPRTWYGMPAYAKDGKVLCFFQSATKFKTRYATLGFSDTAALDDGLVWPTSYALTDWTPAVEAQVRDLILKAIS